MAEDLFCRIIAGEVPADIVYKDETVVAFRDIDPKARVHVLIVPRRHIPKLTDASEEDVEVLGRVLLAARKIAELEGIAESGFRLIANTGPDAGQEVFHVHFHVMGGEPMGPMVCK